MVSRQGAWAEFWLDVRVFEFTLGIWNPRVEALNPRSEALSTEALIKELSSVFFVGIFFACSQEPAREAGLRNFLQRMQTSGLGAGDQASLYI